MIDKEPDISIKGDNSDANEMISDKPEMTVCNVYNDRHADRMMSSVSGLNCTNPIENECIILVLLVINKNGCNCFIPRHN